MNGLIPKSFFFNVFNKSKNVLLIFLQIRTSIVW